MARVLVGTSGWSYASWRGPLLSDGPSSEASSRILRRVSSKRWNWMASSIARLQPNPSGVGAMKPGNISSLHGKRRNSSPTGNACPRTRSTACNSSMICYRFSATRSGQFSFSCRRTSSADAGRLGSFLTLLPEHRRYSFEFRHPSWYAPKILGMLADRNIAICISDHHDAPAPWDTANFVYLRGHGLRGRYESRYNGQRSLHGASRSCYGSRVIATSGGPPLATFATRGRGWVTAEQPPAVRASPSREAIAIHSRGKDPLRFPHASVNEIAPSYRMMKALFTSQRRQKR